MNAFLQNKKTLKKCKIYTMLSSSKKHLSFHTPGHKVGKWDLTELSFSDNLSAPKGCIREAEEDITAILESEKSFLLTDGSTAGVLSMLYAIKLLGAKKLAFPVHSHKSVYNGCALLGLTPVTFDLSVTDDGIPTQVAKKDALPALEQADALLLTSPDYYGNIPDLKDLQSICKTQSKFLLIDGAHGGHLHFEKTLYAGAYADFWVDGVHKNLPAFTQGAVVSTKKKDYVSALQTAVDVFRTTSPSYPIMASVEYAVKFPRNEALEFAVKEFSKKHPDFVRLQEDWTKLCILFGKDAFEIEKRLEKQGIYAEFCDGNLILFYLSPATKKGDFKRLCAVLEKEFARLGKPSVQLVPTPTVFKKIPENAVVEWVTPKDGIGRVCARAFGLFPPCIPLVRVGEIITKEKIELLENAPNVFGLREQKIGVLKEEEL